LSPLDIAGLTLFIIVLFIGVYATVFALPGTVLIFFDVIVYAAITGFYNIGGRMLVFLLALTIVAEGLEFVLGMTGATTFHASRKVLITSTIGSVIGALLLTPWLYGLGTLVGIFLGGFTGILLTELIHQKHLKPAMRDSNGALIGRAAGTLAKGSLALVMVIMTLMTIYS